MKMNPKKSALNSMAEEGGDYKEPTTTEEDDKEDMAEGETEDGCCVKCKCGADLMCADCKESACNCTC